MWALADPAQAGDWVHERTVALADVWADQSYLDTTLPQSIPALELLHPTEPDKVYFFISSFIFAVDLRTRKVVEFNEIWLPKSPSHLKRSSHFVHVWMNDPSCRPDILPRCFSKAKFSAGPDYKKLLKRFAAAHKRSIAAKPVTSEAAQSRSTVIKPIMHDKGKGSKRILSYEDMVMENMQAKKIKFNAVLSKVMESRKNMMASATMEGSVLRAVEKMEGSAVRAVDV